MNTHKKKSKYFLLILSIIVTFTLYSINHSTSLNSKVDYYITFSLILCKDN